MAVFLQEFAAKCLDGVLPSLEDTEIREQLNYSAQDGPLPCLNEANLTAERLSKCLTQQDGLTDSCSMYLPTRADVENCTHPLVKLVAR